MAIEIKVQKDYLTTEASVCLPAQISEVDELLKATKTNGKMVVLYNQGYVQGINITQNTKIADGKSDEIRKILEVDTKEI
jgi:hypothetical protein